MKNHLVFGAGQIGGYLAGVLCADGLNVSMVARPRVVAEYGDTLTLSDRYDQEAKVSGYQFINPADYDGAIAFDIVWLTVKCFALQQAFVELAPMISDDTLIVCCQNGIGSADEVATAFPNNTVLHATVMFDVTPITPNHLRCTTGGPMIVERDPDNRLESELLPLLHSPMLNFIVKDNADGLAWAKLQLNLFNAVNVIADIPVVQALAQRDYRRIYALIMQELLDVAEAKGIQLEPIVKPSPESLPGIYSLPDQEYEEVGKNIIPLEPETRASMWWDVYLGRPTEIDYINGAVVREGKKLGIECKVNAKITAIIKDIENKKRPQGTPASELLEELTSTP